MSYTFDEVGQGPIALVVGAGGECLDIFTLLYPFSSLSPSLWETARYRLKYCLNGPLNPKQPTNQIQEFHRKYVLVPADKAADNVVVVRRLQYINTLKQELNGTKAYEQTSAGEKSVINHHVFQNATRFGVSVNEDQERLPTFYWIPKLHKQT